MVKNIFSAIFLGLFLNIQVANSADAELQTMVDQFVSQSPTQWSLTEGRWEYVDIVKCFLYGVSCFGNNPTSPYAYPTFGPVDTIGAFKLGQSEAVVIFLRTPPKVRYFGFTQYLFARGQNPKPIFASLSDTLNHISFKTLDQSSKYDELAVIVWTADINTYDKVKDQLAKQGIPESLVNFLPIPITQAFTKPLQMGYGDDADQFSMLFRAALPDVPENWSLYMKENPVKVYKINPNSEDVLVPAPILGYKNEHSGISESADLKAAVDSLVQDVKMNYLKKYAFKEFNVDYTEKVGWECIDGISQCAGDNHDALYSTDSSVITVKNLKDVYFVVGVNHQKTGKALYVNHTVYELQKITGIVSVADTVLSNQSAYYHAGLRNLDIAKKKLYSQLYVYAISYDCTGIEYCKSIPAPTPENPIGLAPGTPFMVVGRKYVDPVTTVRPDPSELTQHRSFIAGLK